MHAALRGMDVVGKGEDRLVIAVVVLEGHLCHGIVLHAGHVDHLGVQGILGLVEPGDKLPDAAGIAHVVLLLLAGTLVHGADAQSGVEEGLFPHPGVEDLIVIDRVLKHLGVGLEGHGGTGTVRCAHHGHFLGDMSPGELHFIDLSVPVDLDGEPLGQGVDHAGAHAVEAAGDLVSATAELAAGVEHGIHHFQSGPSRLGLDVHGDAAAVVHHGDGVAVVDLHQNVGAVARQGLVDGVVHDLVDQVVQSGRRGGADIHAGALAHRLQPFQHLDFRSIVFVVGVHRGGLQDFIFSHAGFSFQGKSPRHKARRAEPEPHFRPVSPCPE